MLKPLLSNLSLDPSVASAHAGSRPRDGPKGPVPCLGKAGAYTAAELARRVMARPIDSRHDRGASLVEFALLAPIVFALLLGMITGGLALSKKNSMENAVREGARFGATLPEDDGWAAAVQARVVELSGGDLDASDVCVALIRKADATTEKTRKSSSCASAAAAEPSATNVPSGQCAVKVWARESSELNVIFFSRTLTLDTSNINRYERDGDPSTCA